ncbi:hypothetical protein I2483_08335 [Sporosarcina sp. E16_3]|uniref:hypothetical protein n=1 Tax=Sporosarcina sp. E16_3 TaxID=2789293 RepID=UPI001A92FEEF|nr:hypothetical protein [Sporosarcina sp. E16_3]MBO0601664.1 hypothetical protein [Sporosarcina sp. E16_3]
MKDHHTINGKKCVGMRQIRIPTHPDISVIVIEVIQSKAIQKRNHTSSGQGRIKLLTGWFWLINTCEMLYNL